MASIGEKIRPVLGNIITTTRSSVPRETDYASTQNRTPAAQHYVLHYTDSRDI